MKSTNCPKFENGLDIRFSILSKTHIREISKIHQEELDIGVLDLFGIKFLENMYNELLKENHGFIVKSGDEIIGFVSAIKKDISFLKCLSVTSIITFFLIFLKNLKSLGHF